MVESPCLPCFGCDYIPEKVCWGCFKRDKNRCICRECKNEFNRKNPFSSYEAFCSEKCEEEFIKRQKDKYYLQLKEKNNIIFVGLPYERTVWDN